MLNTKQSFLVLVAGLILSAGVSASDDPHWDKNACQVCHLEAAPVDGQVNLNAMDTETLCDTCHGKRGDALPCRHASDIPLGNLDIADELRSSLKDGQVVCFHKIVCFHQVREIGNVRTVTPVGGNWILT